jgi:hypothetical protein
MKIKELFRRDKNVCENEKPKTNMKLRDFLKVAGLKVLVNEKIQPSK